MRQRKKQTLWSVILTVAAILLFVAAAIIPLFLKDSGRTDATSETSKPSGTVQAATTTASAPQMTASVSITSSKAILPPETVKIESTAEPSETAETVVTTAVMTDDMIALKNRVRKKDVIIPDGPSFEEISPDGKIDYARLPYVSVVQESEKAPDDYFDDALFIGNSIQQIQRQVGRLDATFMTTGDFNVYRYFEWPLRRPDGEEQLVSEYVEQNRFGKIYLGFGINEVSYENQERMWQGYRDMLTHVKTHQPGAIIYLQGVLPVYPPLMNETAKELITPENILEFNHKLAILAEDEGVYMVNPAEAIQDENGLLDEEWSLDGVHFGPTATEIWDTYLEHHVVLPGKP